MKSYFPQIVSLSIEKKKKNNTHAYLIYTPTGLSMQQPSIELDVYIIRLKHVLTSL